METRDPTSIGDIDLDLLFAGLYQDSDSSSEDESSDTNAGSVYLRKQRSSLTSSKILCQLNSSGPPSEFKRTEKLGSGTSATVCKFTDENKNDIAVKRPHRSRTLCSTVKSKKRRFREVEKELEYLRRVYPDEGPYSIYCFDEPNLDPNSKQAFIADWRLIMPYVPGMSFYKFLQRMHDPDILALVMYNAIIEMERIHQLHVVHGDVSLNNMIIKPDFTVHFVDFSFAYDYYDDDDLATTVEIPAETTTYFAPERVNTKKCSASPLQDVYSLTHAFNSAIDYLRHAEDKIYFHSKYACLTTFIANGLSPTPADRETLLSLLPKLNPLMSVARLKLFLEEDETPERQTLIENLLRDRTENEIQEILLSLCRHQEYKNAQKFLELIITKMPHGEQNAFLELISLIAELGSKLPQFTGKYFNDNTRTQMIMSLQIGMKVANMVIDGGAISTTIAANMQRQPALKNIYEDLCAQGYLIAPTTSTCKIV